MNQDPTVSPSSFEFDLPQELIAQTPPDRRGAARMLLVDGNGGLRGEEAFTALPGLLQPGDLLVLNDSRVLPARLFTRRSDTGGLVELLLIEPGERPGTWLAMARPARRLRPGVGLVVTPPPDIRSQEAARMPTLEITAALGAGQVLVRGEDDPGEVARAWGVMPLPPYIKRDFQRPEHLELARLDRRRYQTVYAADDPAGGASVAAPTAGLHFDGPVLDALAERGVEVARVRLHVGPGTFRPPDQEQIRSRRLHPERFICPGTLWGNMRRTRARGGRVIAVGTTSLRVLETVARLGLEKQSGTEAGFPAGGEGGQPVFTGTALRDDAGWEVRGTTRLFIMPPEPVTAVDGLLTNFHLPGSSLLMLVASLLQPGDWRPVYQEAVRRRLRFYSYGDCMLVLKKGGFAHDR